MTRIVIHRACLYIKKRTVLVCLCTHLTALKKGIDRHFALGWGSRRLVFNTLHNYILRSYASAVNTEPPLPQICKRYSSGLELATYEVLWRKRQSQQVFVILNILVHHANSTLRPTNGGRNLFWKTRIHGRHISHELTTIA